MMRIIDHLKLTVLGLLCASQVSAQSFNWISSGDDYYWKTNHVSLREEAAINPDLTIKDELSGITFQAWGTCFNELGWDALNLVSKEEKEIILNKLFSPDGDLRFTIGRFAMNANDYARKWYSCDEVDGDFQLKYFKIDEDKSTLIPYIKEAQQRNPKMTFWISPSTTVVPVFYGANLHFIKMAWSNNLVPLLAKYGNLIKACTIAAPLQLISDRSHVVVGKRYTSMHLFDVKQYFAHYLGLDTERVEIYHHAVAFLEGQLAFNPDLDRESLCGLHIGSDFAAAIRNNKKIYSLNWEEVNYKLSALWLLRKYHQITNISVINIEQLTKLRIEAQP